MLWIGLLGALVATRSREHIAIDVLSRFAPVPVRTIMHFVAAAFAAFYLLGVGLLQQNFVQTAYEFGDKAFADVPAWLLQLIIPITFGLMGVRFTVAGGANLVATSQKVGAWYSCSCCLAAVGFAGAPLFAIIAASAMWGFGKRTSICKTMAINIYQIAEMPVLVAIPLFTLQAICWVKAKRRSVWCALPMLSWVGCLVAL